MKHDIVILNFSDVYTEETFYKDEKIKWINCTDISGADCFCDGEASAEICRRIKDLPPQGNDENLRKDNEINRQLAELNLQDYKS